VTTEVTITGTGVPHAAPGRAGAGVLVRSGDTTLQFDAGRATTLRLAEAGVATGALDALFVTHHHSDHLTGLTDVVFTRWVENQGRHVPLPVVAPHGPCVRFLERMMDPWADDIDVRMTHVGRSDGPEPRIIGFEATPEATEVWHRESVRVLAGAVHHEPVSPSVGYRVETPDGAIAISGDTRVCDEVAALADGVDVLVHEAFRRDAMAPVADAFPHLRAIADYHADTVALGAQLAEVDVGALVLTHLIPAPRDDDDKQLFVDDVRRGGYTGPVVVADDLETVTL